MSVNKKEFALAMMNKGKKDCKVKGFAVGGAAKVRLDVATKEGKQIKKIKK